MTRDSKLIYISSERHRSKLPGRLWRFLHRIKPYDFIECRDCYQTWEYRFRYGAVERHDRPEWIPITMIMHEVRDPHAWIWVDYTIVDPKTHL